MALLKLLYDYYPQPKERMIVAHVNYGLRGRDSQKDESLVRETCEKLGLPCRILRVKSFKARVGREKRSLQDLAREIRYSFFAKIAHREKAWGVAVAHHQEDQAETVLDRLLRGAGARGLSGLRPIQTLWFPGQSKPLRVWRPLLSYEKNTFRTYLKESSFFWREDRSNGEDGYRRNRIRNRLLPYLTKWNPRIRGVLARVGEIISEEDRLLESMVAPMGPKIQAKWVKGKFQALSVPFGKFPLALKRRFVREVAEKLNPNARGLSFERIEEVIRVWEGKERGPRDIGFGLSANQKGGRILMFLSR